MLSFCACDQPVSQKDSQLKNASDRDKSRSITSNRESTLFDAQVDSLRKVNGVEDTTLKAADERKKAMDDL